MRKIISEISEFISTNKILFWLLIVSIFIFTSYNLTMDEPELFPGAEFIYNLCSQLSLAYVGSFIFYIVQVYIPEKKRRKRMKENLYYYLYEILDLMGHIYCDICTSYSEPYNMLNIQITESQFEKLKKKFKLRDKVFCGFKFGEISYYEYISNIIEDVEKNIEKMHIAFGYDLDDEIKELLLDITNSSLHREFYKIEIDYSSDIYWPQITKYYGLYRRLYKYIDENK